MRATEIVPYLFTFYIDNVIVQLKYYRLFRPKTTWWLNINIAWHVPMNFTDRILIFFVCLLWLRITEEKAWTKQRFLDIKRDFIEQKEHLLNKLMSSECNHMKIIKVKWLILSLFLTCVTLLLGWLVFNDLSAGRNDREVCFRRKGFLKSDTVVGFTRSSSLKPMFNSCIFSEFYN